MKNRIFDDLKAKVKVLSTQADFLSASSEMERHVFALALNDFRYLITEIGIIPEDIAHDSSEEKLYAKVTDIVLARCFRELGLSSSVNRERANCADILAKSIYHDYSMVGDAKAFRLSRTAKNQKDFKVKSMVDWRGDHDYAVLVCPFYQYPRNNSQIFGQALDGNVSLFSWEHLSLMISQGIIETERLNLSPVWNISREIATKTIVSNRNDSFLQEQNTELCRITGLDASLLAGQFTGFRRLLIERGGEEIDFWVKYIEKVKAMPLDEAIENLLKTLKLKEKIASIHQFISYLER